MLWVRQALAREGRTAGIAHLAAGVMSDYHRRLAAGADSAVALADASAAAGRTVPFVCFGAAVRFPSVD
jgi:hypothetical protein